MLIRGAHPAERTLLRDEAGELEHLPGDEAALVAAVGVLHHVAHVAERQLHVLVAHAGLEPEGVEQHLGAKWYRDRLEHLCLPGKAAPIL
jgi:hypothetical protein